MKKRLAIALAAALVVAAAIVQPVAAAPPVQLIPTQKAGWPDRGFVVSLRSGQRIQPSRFTVLENGQPVLGARVLPASAVRGSFGAMLVIDTSNSMRGAPIRGAMEAASTFAARRNLNQRLSLLVFNSSNELLLPFTRSQTRIRNAFARTPGLASPSSSLKTSAHVQLRFLFPDKRSARLERFFGIEEDCDRAFIHQLHGHHGLKNSRRDAYAQFSQSCAKFFV